MSLLGKMIKRLRLKRGLSQGDVAYFLEIHPQNISNYEMGRVDVPVRHFNQLAKILKCNIDLIVDTHLEDVRSNLKL